MKQDSLLRTGFAFHATVATTMAWSSGLRDPSHKTYVGGRYAYAIYDEGGLLDANVAEYRPGINAAQLRNKGVLTLADLKHIPGFRDIASDRQDAIIQNLVG